MAKESYYTSETPRSCIFRETFADEFSVRKNGGIMADVTFSEGRASFNGTSSYIANKLPVITPNNVGFSIRVRFKVNSITTTVRYLADLRYNVNTNGAILFFNTNGTLSYGRVPTAYIDGVLTASDTFTPQPDIWYDAVFTRDNTTYLVDGAAIGCLNSLASFFFDGEVGLFEVYNYPLSQEEAINLYNNSRHIKPGFAPLLHMTAERGVIEDRAGGSFTNTDVEVKKDGDIYTHNYNGSTSFLETSTTFPTGDFSVSCWARSFITGNDEMYIDVNATSFYIRKQVADTIRIQLYDGSSNLSVSSIAVDNILDWNNYICTFDLSAKSINIYVNGEFYALDFEALFTTIPSSLPILVGKYATNTLYALGNIGEIIIEENIWTAEEISQYYSATKHKYGK